MSHSRSLLRIVCHRESEGFAVVSRLQIGGEPRSITAHQISSRGGHLHFYGLCMIIGTPLCRSKADLGVTFAKLSNDRHTLTQHAHIIFRGRTQDDTVPHTLRTREYRHLSSHVVGWSRHHRAILRTACTNGIFVLASIRLLPRVLTTNVVCGFVSCSVACGCHRSTDGGETSINALCPLRCQSRSTIVDGLRK